MNGTSVGRDRYDVVGASEGPDIGTLAPDSQSFLLRALATHLDRISAAVINKDAPAEQVEYEVDASNLGAGGQSYKLPSGSEITSYYIENGSSGVLNVYAGASASGRSINSLAATTFRTSLAPQQTTSIAIVPVTPAATGLLRIVLTTIPLSPTIGTSSSGSAVSVTNFPATQPVSAAALPLPAGASTAALQPAINADGGSQAHIMNFPATQPVSAAALPLPAGASTAALQPAINADGGSQAHIMNFPATQPVSAAALPLPAGAATAANQVTTAKGTQPALAVPTQDLKDSGRVSVCITNAGTVAATATEAFLATLQVAKAGSALLTAQSSYTVTTGKTLRIESITVILSVGGAGTFGANFAINFRGNTAGGVVLTSNVLLPVAIVTGAPSSNTTISIPIPDGLEIASATSIGITQQCGSTNCFLPLTIIGYEY